MKAAIVELIFRLIMSPLMVIAALYMVFIGQWPAAVAFTILAIGLQLEGIFDYRLARRIKELEEEIKGREDRLKNRRV